MKKLRRLAYEFDFDQSQRKSTQVGGQTKRTLKAKSENLRRLASPFGQDVLNVSVVR